MNEESDQPATLGELDQHLGFLLRLAQLAVFKDLNGVLKPFELRVSECSVMMVIASNEGLRQQDLARLLKIQNPNMAPILDMLVERGLVRRDRSDRDKRAYALSLTEEGLQLLEQVKPLHEAHEKQLKAAVKRCRIEDLVEDLRAIATFAD